MACWRMRGRGRWRRAVGARTGRDLGCARRSSRWPGRPDAAAAMAAAYATGTVATGTTWSRVRWYEITPKVTRPAVVAPAARANNQNRRGRSRTTPAVPLDLRLAIRGGRVALVASPAPAKRCRIRSRMTTATAPGSTRTAIAGQMAPVAASRPATSSGPAMAPSWSSALWTAKPRPRPTPAAAWARRAVFAGLRTALPVRSARIRTHATTRPAPARNGVTARAGTQMAVMA